MLKTSVLTVDGFVAKETMDPLMHDLRFDSSQSMLICTRYSLFQILLCDTLNHKFPAGYNLSFLPIPDILHRVDTNAAITLR
jgi:hypothetical protein